MIRRNTSPIAMGRTPGRLCYSSHLYFTPACTYSCIYSSVPCHSHFLFADNRFPVTLVAENGSVSRSSFFGSFVLCGLSSWLIFEFRTLRQIVITRNIAGPPPRPVAAAKRPASATLKTATRHTKEPLVWQECRSFQRVGLCHGYSAESTRLLECQRRS